MHPLVELPIITTACMSALQGLIQTVLNFGAGAASSSSSSVQALFSLGRFKACGTGKDCASPVLM